MESDHIDIRGRIRAHTARQLTIARLGAPDDWQAELRHALAAHREPATIFAGSDLRLFLQSFAVFFTATMMFLI
ncbi:MAG: hypothetical protein CVT78_03360 [Alphaproteobacteria bacterium HGW-Alphaproteobacteria-17]|uniref:hypothetical protein n=1 Tax=Sphingopyxis solisilvae TaxID=1886788 RepID=UPI000CB2DB43|nr:hypothetical protein [Sphingopyxis solisilvae]PKP88303.1 MAG: hypothetical protein CVT78_03360 [Alphaproteobacteria bacterium HGW-Alphaproteobacteria-17]